VNDHGNIQNLQILCDDQGFQLPRGAHYEDIDQLIVSLSKGSTRPLLSKHPEHKGEPLYLKAGRVATEEDIADDGSSA
jgi:hypothetical protein